MQTCNRNYFNAYDLTSNILLAVICCFGLACNTQNNTKQSLAIVNEIHISESAVNINVASTEELQKLSGIGQQKARAIVKHREKFGKFRKPEHVLLVRGISDELFRKAQTLIKVE